jgi:hypothetical protein
MEIDLDKTVRHIVVAADTLSVGWRAAGDPGGNILSYLAELIEL